MKVEVGSIDERRRDILERTFRFSVRIVKLCQVLDQHPGVGRTQGRHLLRSGTPIGANAEEAQAGQSRADFVSKYSIACKEARETHYWLRLIAECEIVPATRFVDITQECDEGTFPVDRFHQLLIRDPKERLITAPCFDERVLHHAIMNLCEPVLDRWFIDDTFA